MVWRTTWSIIGGAHIESRGGEGATVMEMAERPEASLEIADVDRDLGVRCATAGGVRYGDGVTDRWRSILKALHGGGVDENVGHHLHTVVRTIKLA